MGCRLLLCCLAGRCGLATLLLCQCFARTYTAASQQQLSYIPLHLRRANAHYIPFSYARLSLVESTRPGRAKLKVGQALLLVTCLIRLG